MKRGMKKAVAFFMAVAMCTTPFTGCGSDADNASDTTVSTNSTNGPEAGSKEDSKSNSDADSEDTSDTEATSGADSGMDTSEPDAEMDTSETDSEMETGDDSETESGSTANTTSESNSKSKDKSKSKSKKGSGASSQSEAVTIPIEEVVVDPEPARGEVTYEELQSTGVKCQEYINSEENMVYVKITNDGEYAKYLTITASFKKGSDVVYETETYWDVASKSYCIADIYSEEAFDSVEYTYVEEDAEFRAYADKDLDVTCEVDNKEGILSGTVTNHSAYTIEYPEVHFVFYDKDKNIIGHTVVSADENEVNPSDSSTFESSFQFTVHDSYEVYATATLKL